MRLSHAILIIACMLFAVNCKASEALWDFVPRQSYAANRNGDDPNTKVGEGHIDWYVLGEDSPDGNYHIISAGLDITQTDATRNHTTTITPNNSVTLSYGGRVAIADYGTLINAAFFDAITTDIIFDASTYHINEEALLIHNDLQEPYSKSVAYLVFEDKTYSNNKADGYAWVEIYYGNGELLIGDSGLVFGSDSSIVTGQRVYTYAGIIPEPTSGLLLLLGVAGLTLRRKQK